MSAVASKAQRASRTPAECANSCARFDRPTPAIESTRRRVIPMKEFAATGGDARQAQAPAALHHAANYKLPDARGHFGIYGGSFAAETLTQALEELKQAYARYRDDPAFLEEFHYEL